MNPKIRQLGYFLLSPFLGKKNYQSFFESLYLLSLAGMNYGHVVPGKSGEINVLNFIKSEYKDKSKITIFDIGANKGDYTDRVVNIFDNKANIHVFEPLKSAFKILNKKFDQNKKIKIYNFGFSNKASNSIIHYDENSSELASLYNRRFGTLSMPVPFVGEEKIKLKSLDTFCKNNNISKIDLLKIDTEGHELKVLEGAGGMLKNGKIRYIQFEFGGTMIDSRTFFIDIFSYLSPNYRIYRILQDGFELIDNCNEKNEIFIIGNFFAINKKVDPK